MDIFIHNFFARFFQQSIFRSTTLFIFFFKFSPLNRMSSAIEDIARFCTTMTDPHYKLRQTKHILVSLQPRLKLTKLNTFAYLPKSRLYCRLSRFITDHFNLLECNTIIRSQASDSSHLAQPTHHENMGEDGEDVQLPAQSIQKYG